MKKYTPTKVDGNQRDIVLFLQAVGATVVDLHAVGKACPDLLVGWQGVNYLLEVKNPDGRNRLEEDQKGFFASWKGRAPCVVRCIQDVQYVLGIKTV